MSSSDKAADQSEKGNCNDALNAVRDVVETKPSESSRLSELRGKTSNSLRDFNQSSSRAIKRLYAGPRRERGIYHHDSESGSASSEDDTDSSADDSQKAGPNETVFLIYL